jgi:hypothetical protein
MVFVKAPAGFSEHLVNNEILVLGSARLRLVTHLDVDATGIDRVLAAARDYKGAVR